VVPTAELPADRVPESTADRLRYGVGVPPKVHVAALVVESEIGVMRS